MSTEGLKCAWPGMLDKLDTEEEEEEVAPNRDEKPPGAKPWPVLALEGWPILFLGWNASICWPLGSGPWADSGAGSFGSSCSSCSSSDRVHEGATNRGEGVGFPDKALVVSHWLAAGLGAAGAGAALIALPGS